MIKHKIILIFILAFYTVQSCAGTAKTDARAVGKVYIENDTVAESTGPNSEVNNDDKILNNKPEYQDGDMHINELNLQIKKLQAELQDLL